LCEDASVAILVELKNIISQNVSDPGCQSVGKRGGRKLKRTRQGQLSRESWSLICETAIPMTPPTITTPATILSVFAIFSVMNSALSGGVSVGGEEGEGGAASDVKWCDGANPSGSVVARSDPVGCEDGGISDDPELEG
jgi:hypothetical protein